MEHKDGAQVMLGDAVTVTLPKVHDREAVIELLAAIGVRCMVVASPKHA